MALVHKIKEFISSWEKKDFYVYTGLFLGFVCVVTLGLIFYSQYTMSDLERRIDEVNELRETSVKDILGRAREVEQQRKNVNEMLAKEKDFNIASYFKKLLNDLNISGDKQERFEILQAEREDDYREDSLSVRLVDMNMQKLTELLQEIEQNQRIYSKDLEINKSPKKADAIEVSITIATLQPKAEPVE